ncbi:uncharacterized protein TRIADDRAFT_61843 [Trichoplax adhaerens]|uniref:Uncharacterized protein n=1 Tax=Trichoplax adhaerens TaxID=10228 RepID=B3SC43_TRIAD|nr:hypothetical protein TRIADDRAFT_61843 [Trichoplax adhaerens]EDV19789.1 hypothetical protein TRIADDRAFT_61843 [Trichoplax adhaerens]|eukprot:XP_002117813.1 hypothetical protein TRIADDRAFT_61843 [Trichoplax adhaerens]
MATNSIFLSYTILMIAVVVATTPGNARFISSAKRHTLREQPTFIPLGFGRRNLEDIKVSRQSHNSDVLDRRNSESIQQGMPSIMFGKRNSESTQQGIPSITFGKRNSESTQQGIPSITFGKRNSASTQQGIPSITFGKRNSESIQQGIPSITFGKRNGKSIQQGIPSITFGKRNSESIRQNIPPIMFGKRDSKRMEFRMPTLTFSNRDNEPKLYGLPSINLHKRDAWTKQTIVPRDNLLARQLYNYGPEMYTMPEDIAYLTSMTEPSSLDYQLSFAQSTPDSKAFGKYNLPIWNLDSTGLASGGFVDVPTVYLESGNEIPMAMLKRRSSERFTKDMSTSYDQKKKLFLGLPRFGDQDRSAKSALKDELRLINRKREYKQPPPIIYEGK